MINIRCNNNGQMLQVAEGSTLEEVYDLITTGTGPVPAHKRPVVAHVNNKVEGMHYRVYNDKIVEFLDITSPSGLRC